MMVKQLRPKDTVSFRCQRCGTCCRNLRNSVMVESLDAYRIARYLREHGYPDIEVADVFDQYTTPMILLGTYPIFMVNTTGPDDACVFLKNGACSIYPARMRVCRLYPFSVDTGERGRDFIWYQCLERPFHFTGGTVRVKDWFYENFSKEDREFVKRESKTIPLIGKWISNLEGEALHAADKAICLLRYFLYDVEEPFLPQYERNTESLLHQLRKLAEEHRTGISERTACAETTPERRLGEGGGHD